jgi:hypothetical protein
MVARGARPGGREGAKLILAKACVLTVSKAFELALLIDAKLDVSKAPANERA